MELKKLIVAKSWMVLLLKMYYYPNSELLVIYGIGEEVPQSTDTY